MEMNVIDKYTIENIVLGTGSFSIVMLGYDTTSSQIVAIKKIDIHKQRSLDRIKLEIDLMQKLDHPNIVTYYDVIKKSDYWYIIMEYCNHGTLEDVIKSHQSLSLDAINLEKSTFYYLNQLKNALNYVRKNGYIHRDIKPQNVLLVKNENENISELSIDLNLNLLFNDNSNMGGTQSKYHYDQKLVLKLADFGLAKSYNENSTDMMKTICGSPIYMSPELLINGAYNSKSDLWSFGVIMYEMLFLVCPIQAVTLEQLQIKLRTMNINFLLTKNGSLFSTECMDLLTKLLDKNYKTRIEWEYFFNHKWFNLNQWNATTNSNGNHSSNSLDGHIDDSFSDKYTHTEEIQIGSSSSSSRTTRAKSNLSRMKANSFSTNKIIPGNYIHSSSSVSNSISNSYSPNRISSGSGGNTSNILNSKLLMASYKFCDNYSENTPREGHSGFKDQ